MRLWDVSNPTTPIALASPLFKFTKAVYFLAFTPDGLVLEAASADTGVMWWQMANPAHPVPLGESALTGSPNEILDLAFSPDGNTMAAAEQNEGIGLWDTSTWDGRFQVPQKARPTGDTGTVSVVAFSPDSHTMASSATDGTLRLWDTADLEKATPRGTITGHDGAINAVVFSPDGRTVATAGDDQTVEITILDPQAAGQAICSLTAGAVNRQRWQQYLPRVPYEDPCR